MGKYGSDEQMKFFYKNKFLGACEPGFAECPKLLELMESDKEVATSILNYMNSLGDPVFPISEEDWGTPETNVDNVDITDLYNTFLQELDYEYRDFPDDFYIGGDYLLPNFEIFVGPVAEDNVVGSTSSSVTASANDSSIANKIYSVMMNYEYGYDPDMTDINAMLQELTNKGVHVDTSDAFKKAWVSAHNKAERKTWGGSGDSYHYDSLTPGELDAIENYDTEYWEYVKDHPLNLKPASIKSSTGCVKAAKDDKTYTALYNGEIFDVSSDCDALIEQLKAEIDEAIADGDIENIDFGECWVEDDDEEVMYIADGDDDYAEYL